MRRAFTLIELLVIIGIMGAMVTVGVVSVRGGQGAVRVRGAARDAFAAIRHARSTALVTGQPAIITYSTDEVDGEVVAKIEITSAKLLDTTSDKEEVVGLTDGPSRRNASERSQRRAKEVSVDTTTASASKGTSSEEGEAATAKDTVGESIEDVLFSPIDMEVVKGMRLKVLHGDELPDVTVAERKTKLSVFSTADYLIKKFSAKKAEEKKTETSATSAETKSATPAEQQEPVSIVWEANGRVEAHQVWIYADGQKPEEGLLIRVDRFGGAKVVPGDGREED